MNSSKLGFAFEDVVAELLSFVGFRIFQERDLQQIDRSFNGVDILAQASGRFLFFQLKWEKSKGTQKAMAQFLQTSKILRTTPGTPCNGHLYRYVWVAARSPTSNASQTASSEDVTIIDAEGVEDTNEAICRILLQVLDVAKEEGDIEIPYSECLRKISYLSEQFGSLVSRALSSPPKSSSPSSSQSKKRGPTIDDLKDEIGRISSNVLARLPKSALRKDDWCKILEALRHNPHLFAGTSKITKEEVALL
jgi:hypothetical protein